MMEPVDIPLVLSISRGEIFATIRPATAMVDVGRLLDPDMLVEIEAEAIVSS
jgi:enamine deaminase RidA (YjgF/YER057c/UK114 family)